MREPGDMMMADRAGIVSSVLRGPDHRTRVTARAQNALFAVYAPAGVGQHVVHGQLDAIRSNVLLVSPDAETELLATLPTDAASGP